MSRIRIKHNCFARNIARVRNVITKNLIKYNQLLRRPRRIGGEYQDVLIVSPFRDTRGDQATLVSVQAPLQEPSDAHAGSPSPGSSRELRSRSAHRGRSRVSGIPI